ncbi:MAG: hypothetical protein DRO88_00425 [Promethearchaeia archaeon]|nr:MAG: hypothetical protein DRO88_00425 [Candidatus Lokiarchaeia archaeon]
MESQNNWNTEDSISYELLSFVAVFFLFSLFGIIIILVELDAEEKILDRILLEQFLYISIISTVLSLIQLIRYFYKLNLVGQPSEKDYSPIRAYQLRGGNVIDFYHLHEKLVLRGDPTFQKLQAKYQRNSAYFSFFCILGGVIVILFLNRSRGNSSNPHFTLEIIISGLIYIAFLIFMLIRLVKLANRKRTTLEIRSNEFNQYLDKLGINIHTNPITRRQLEIREFLELTNFLQKFYQNHFRNYLGILFILVIITSIGIILRFSGQSTLMFRRIGFALIILSAIGFAINHARFMMKRELYLMTRYTLSSYFMLI